MRKLLFAVLVLSSSCMQDDPHVTEYTGNTPATLNDGWQIATPESQNIDPVQLDQAYADAYANEDLWPLRSLLVFRNNALVSESYFKDPKDITYQRPIWSCTKQVMGILTGIALHDGLIESLDQPVSYYLDAMQSYPDKQDITIKNMLNMQSGIDYSNDGASGQTDDLLQQNPDNSVTFILDRPMYEVPGRVFHYNDGNPHLISAMLQDITLEPTKTWAEQVFFSKIGAENLDWYNYKDGVTLGGFGILTTPREMGKIGQFILNEGQWNGEQLIDINYLTDMLDTQIRDDEYGWGFGYFWWINLETGIRYMHGHGGQFVFVIPEKNMLVVITSEPYTEGDFQVSADEGLTIVKQIIEASE